MRRFIPLTEPSLQFYRARLFVNIYVNVSIIYDACFVFHPFLLGIMPILSKSIAVQIRTFWKPTNINKILNATSSVVSEIEVSYRVVKSIPKLDRESSVFATRKD